MAGRDAAEYKESKTNAAEIDKIPELVAQCIAEHWNGRVPPKDVFVREVAKLTSIVLYILLKDGKLAALTGGMAEIEDGRRLATHIIGEILVAKNPRMMAQCCDLAFGLGIQGGRTETNIADEHHVGRATVSGICTTLKETYTGKPGTGMKSNEAVEKYRANRIGKRAKPLPSQWEFAELFARQFSNDETNKRKR